MLLNAPVTTALLSDGDRNFPALRCRGAELATSFPGMKRRLPEATVVLVAVLVRLVYFVQFRATPYYAHPLVDAHLYDEKAWRIAGGDWLGDAVFYQDPFYPYFLALLYRAWRSSDAHLLAAGGE